MSTSFWTPQGEREVGGERDTDVLGRLAAASLRRGQDGPEEESQEVKEMRKNRRINRKLDGISRTADLMSGSGASSLSFATGRPQDPMFYWKQANLPYDIWKEEELVVIRHYCRLLYLTHPLLASAIDIFSKYPMQGMELACKDNELVDFYTTHFLEDLNYPEYLTDVLHERWLVGEAWPLGQWNDTLGIWEDDELINPDDVDVIKSPFIKEPRFEMRLPETLRKILKERQPEWEYKKLVNAYPELLAFLADDARMPVSNILLKQIKFKADTFHPRGIPILMRGFRAIFQEEMLNAAQDAIASRLYTPLILAKIGASATDLGTTYPFIPTSADLADFEEALDEALAADFRVLTHHFALTMESVFGREVMPDLSGDFDRLAERQLQVFGISKTMLSGAADGETYAADALNLDIMSQLLGGAQRLIKRFFKERALVVAEAQQHWDYEIRGGKKFPVMEEVLEVDEETGEKRIIEQPKLLVPDLVLKSMDMKNDVTRRQLLEELRQTGVPISMKSRLQNIDIDLDDEIEQTRDEQIKIAVATEETRRDTFSALTAQGLPIPDDLEQDFRAKALDAEVEAPAAEQMPLPNMAMDPAAAATALVPGPEDYAMEEQAEEEGAVGPDTGASNADGPPVPPMATIIPLPRQRMRPEESDERRGDMPKKSALIRGDDGEDHEEGSHRLISGPAHIGMRRYVDLDPTAPLPDAEADR
jgi:hypothetical protein